MLLTSHVLAGALLGAALRRHPIAAFSIGVGSHLAMDAIPHWGVDDPGAFLFIAANDGIAAMFIAAILLFFFDARSRWAVAAGMLGAALLDANKPFTQFWGWSPFPTFVDHFHGGIQAESPSKLGFELTVIAVLGVAALLTAWTARYVWVPGNGRHRADGTARFGGHVQARRKAGEVALAPALAPQRRARVRPARAPEVAAA